MKTSFTAIAALFVLCSAAAAQDLDGNLTADSAQLRAGAQDCNRNGFLDTVDVARPHFSTAVEHLNGVQQSQNSTWDLCPIDFDRDGRPDLAICTFTSTNFGTITLWHNVGGPGLVYHSEIPFPDSRPTIIKCADLNGDGRADLVAADSSYNRAYVMLATGDGAFAPAVTLPADASNNGSVGLAVGDLDADGDIDIAMTSWGTNKVNIFRNAGNGTFGPRASYTTDYQPRDVAIGDFTGDGLADLAIANEYYSANPPGANGTVSLLRNTGSAVFVAHATIAMPIGNAPFNYQARPQFVELFDIDHDGVRDLITSSKLSNTLAVHLNDGSGTFTLAQRFGGVNIEGNARDVQIADLDGDGWEEIVWGDQDQNIAAIYRNTAGTFSLHQNFATSNSGSLYLGIADFSGDGRPDIVSANDSARTFSILVNKGGLNLDAPIHLRPQEYGQNAVFADFTGDGLTDMGHLRSDYNQTTFFFSVFAGLGDAVFSKTPIDTPAAMGVIRVRDINHDGRQDLVDVGGHCWVYLGNGDGTFQPRIDSGLPVRAIRSVIADLNMDSHHDLAWIRAGHPGSMLVSFGDGAGRFGPTTEYVMLAEDESIGVGDITGDGVPELFGGFRQQLAPPAGGVLSMLPNNGDGTFGPRQDRFIVASPLSPAVAAIAVADFDGDGDGDVVVSAAGLRLYRNPGGELPATAEIVSSVGVSELRLADADLDGDIDLYGQGATGVVYLNTGSGVFAPPMFMHRYDSNARDIYVADLNNDQRLDLVVRPENSWGTFVFLNFDSPEGECNSNGIPDSCDLASGVLHDGNNNGVPDECESVSCAADFDHSGLAEVPDIFAFLSAWFAQDPSADVDGVAGIGVPDIFAFLSAWFAGCP